MTPQCSKKSFLPHWNGDVYTKYAARFYNAVTTASGWQGNLSQHALTGLTPCKLLDVGCGTGYLLNIALQEKYDAMGIDASSGMLDKAAELYDIDKERLLFTTADQLPFEDHSFDVTIASGSLVHIPNIEASAKEMARITKPGGLIRVIDHAKPKDVNLFTLPVTLFSQLSGDTLHSYEEIFGADCTLESRTTLARGGFMQRFDFRTPSAPSN